MTFNPSRVGVVSFVFRHPFDAVAVADRQDRARPSSVVSFLSGARTRAVKHDVMDFPSRPTSRGFARAENAGRGIKRFLSRARNTNRTGVVRRRIIIQPVPRAPRRLPVDGSRLFVGRVSHRPAERRCIFVIFFFPLVLASGRRRATRAFSVIVLSDASDHDGAGGTGVCLNQRRDYVIRAEVDACRGGEGG